MQAELNLFPARSPSATQKRKLASAMIRVLKGSGEHWTRRDFAERLGFSRDGRQCRFGRKAAHGRILQGQRGYVHIDHATSEDIWECLNNYQSQIVALQAEYRQVLVRARMIGRLQHEKKNENPRSQRQHRAGDREKGI